MFTLNKNRFEKIKSQIGHDFSRMAQVLRLPDSSRDKTYIRSQADKYLTPPSLEILGRDISRLADVFNGTAMRLPTWSYEGFKAGPSVKCFFAFGDAPIDGSHGQAIRIQPKAFILPDSIFSGVIVHETTHFVLRTQDHAYDLDPTHYRVKALPPAKRYENADNWRIFYQYVRAYFRGKER